MVDSMQRASKPIVLSPAQSQPKKSLPNDHFPLWRRSLLGVAYVSLGVVAVGVGAASISYRLSHMTIDSGLVNGRSVRVQAPIDGTIQNFYARPGARVQVGQVLAQLNPMPQLQNNGLPAGLTHQATAVRLTSAQQTLELLQQQLQDLNQQEQALQTATVAMATETVDYSSAEVEATRAEATAARNKYERFRSLLAEGAVSQQEVDELEASWRSSQAAVQQAQSEQNIAQINANALAQQVPVQSNLKDLQSQQRQLMEEIQRQTGQINTLALEVQPTDTTPDSPGTPASEPTPQPSLLPILAPFEGVVYATNYDTGEQVNRPTALLSLLDCHALWADAIVSTNQANRIDISRPVRIQHSGQSETVVGQVDFVTAMSASEISKARAEALVPNVPDNLMGQSLARVRVSIPPTSVQEQDHRFCGVGESAKLTFGTQTNQIGFLSRLFNP